MFAASLASTHWLQVAPSVPACNNKLPPCITRCPLEGRIAAGVQPNSRSQTWPCVTDICLRTKSVIPTLCAGTVAPPGSSVQGIFFPRQEFWSGVPFPPPGDLPNPGIELMSFASPALTGGFFTTEPPWKFYRKACIVRTMVFLLHVWM